MLRHPPLHVRGTVARNLLAGVAVAVVMAAAARIGLSAAPVTPQAPALPASALQCPLSQGFWKNHQELWPVQYLVLGDIRNPVHTYYRSALATLLETPPRGDGSLVLAHQLIAAKLNIANGARRTPIAATLATADALLATAARRLPARIPSATPLGAAMVAAASVLDNFNNSLLPDSCGNRPPTAQAGPNQTVAAGSRVTLNGTGSTDPDGDPLTFHWSLVSIPAGSGAALSDPSAVTPAFTADMAGDYHVQLIVSDGVLSSAPATVRISTGNSPPVADAGPDRTAAVAATIALDGSGSSDVDGQSLTYRWTFVAMPESSAAVLQDANTVSPAFVVDRAGAYVISLIVNDGLADSAADTVTITTRNSPPVARAGSNQTALVTDVVRLDGSGSTDVDGDPLTYAWSLTTRPDDSAAVLDDPAAVLPSFVVDRRGLYVAQLIVHDGTAASAPSTVTITTGNTPPVAHAGADRTALAGGLVVLDGTLSRDADGDALLYSWSLIARPEGSTAALVNPATAAPSFELDRLGTYVAQLIVSDGTADSSPDTVVIDTRNSAPTASAGPDRTGASIGVAVVLDGSASSDPDQHALTFAWSLLSKPAGSLAPLADDTSVNPAFTPDAGGDYVAQLIVHDGFVASAPDTVRITVETGGGPPVANAGPDQRVARGVTVALDGRASADPEGASLTYRWTLTTRPASSNATLANSGGAQPTFVADVNGSYVAELVVNDGSQDSAADAVAITAETGADLRIEFVVAPSGNRTIGSTVNFVVEVRNGSSGTITATGVTARVKLPSGYSLTGNPVANGTYDLATGNWTIGNVAGSRAQLNLLGARINATGPLDFVAEITGADQPDPNPANNVQAAPHVNRPPAANAGGDATVATHAVVALNGAASADPDGDAITYQWAFALRPANTAAVLEGALTATPSFVPDKGGRYTAQLVVTDSNGIASAADTVTITANVLNSAPVIHSPAVTAAATGVAYSYDVAAIDPDAADVLVFSLVAPPDGMTIDPSSGVIAWTPSEAQGGPQPVRVRVQDAAGLFDTQDFVVQVSSLANRAPIARDDGFEVRIDESLGVAAPGVLTNDSDAEGGALTAALVTPPRNGNVTFSADGSFTYTPRAVQEGDFVRLENLNLATRLPGITTSVSSGVGALGIDGMLGSAWETGFGDTQPNFEIVFPRDITVTRLHLFGHRSTPARLITAGIFQLFDASGGELLNTGGLDIPGPAGDVAVDIPNVAGVRRIRFRPTAKVSGTVFSGFDAGFEELRVFGTVLVERPAPVPDPNLGQRLATDVRASSFSLFNRPEGAVDDNPATNWFAGSFAAGEFLELTFPTDVTVTQIRADPSRIRPDGLGTSLLINQCAGSFTLLGAADELLFDSGVVNTPFQQPHPHGGGIFVPFVLDVPAVTGVRRVRYTSAGCVGGNFPPGFEAVTVFGSAASPPSALSLAHRFNALPGREIHSTPLVANFTDDNVDGAIDEHDVPDIVLLMESAASQVTGEIKVVSGDDGRELLSVGAPNLVSPWSDAAVGDIDEDGFPEIVAVHSNGNQLIAFEHTGEVKWTSATNAMPRFDVGSSTLISGAVAIANLDASGRPEIIVGASVFDADGRLLGDGRTLGGTTGGTGLRSAISVVADLDLDGTPEVVAGPSAYRLVNGALALLWRRAGRSDGYAAIANLDDDPRPEIVIVANGTVYALNHDGTDLEGWNAPSHAPVALPAGGQGGAPTVADLDADGIPEVGVAAAHYYIVFNRDGTLRWKSVITDRSSNSTGSTVFDFDGDGQVEIAYRDEQFLRVYRGRDGYLSAKIPISSSTWSEEPVVADVDNDGHADLVVVGDNLSNDPASETGLHVFQDFANQWARTRRIWNQHSYHVTNVNEDASIPLVETPHWLTSGLNGFRLNAFIGGVDADAADSFTYTVHDGALTSNVATARITVRAPNSPPAIISTALSSAARGVPYLYAVQADDPDAADILSFRLPTAPTGMSIDGTSGVIRWSPAAGQLGTHNVVVKVEDHRGAFALQGFAVAVSDPVTVPDVVGHAQAAATAVIGSAGLGVGAITSRHTAVTAPDHVISQQPPGGSLAAPGSAVNLVVSLGPPPTGSVPDVVGLAQPNAEATIVAASFVVGTITTEHHAAIAAGIVLAQSPPAGTIAAGASPVNVTVSLGTSPADLDNDGDGLTPAQGDCKDDDPAIRPGAFDVPGNGVDENCNGVDSVPGDATPPTATLVSPADLADVTVATDLIGSVADANFHRYTLLLAEADQATFTTIGSGTTAVTNGVVGRLDPTLLENGLYRVRLVAEDMNGQTAVDERVYRVDGAAKVGHFRLSFTDLAVPVAGVPVSVVRTYDSRVKARRDFGIGWSLELKTGSYRHNRAPGEGWIIRDQPFLGQTLPCIGGTQETRTHLTEVRLSERESYRFALNVANGNLGITGACEGTASFRFIDGTRPGATLEILGSTEVIYLRGGDDVVLDMDAFLDGTHVPYNPARVRLMLPDGTLIELERGVGVTRIADLNGNQVALTPQGIAHSSGRSISFDRDAEQRITRITDPRGQSLRYAYDGAGDLAGFTDRAGSQTTFRYDAAHRLIEIRDALGRVSRSEYDADGRLVAVIDPAGHRTEFTHDLDDRTETVTDRLGQATVLEYDLRGNVVRRVNPLGQVSTFTYDARDNRLSETDPQGHTRSFAYDARDNLLTQTDPLGHTTTLTYSATNQILSRTDPRGGVATFAYDSRDNLLAEVDAAGGRIAHTYDASGNRTSTIDPAGGVWRFGYNAAGQVTQTTTPVGQVRQVTRDANGNPLVEARMIAATGGPAIATTQFVYDPLDRRTRITNAGGAVHGVTFTATGQVATQTDAAGGVTAFTYDDQDRLVLTVHPDGTSETAAYDAEGRLVTATDRGGRITSRAYDALGRLETTTHPDGATVRAAYDAAGRNISATDELGRTTTFTYDAAGRRTTTRDPLGNVTGASYDAADNVVSTTDGNGQVTSFEYDAANRRTRTLLPNGTSIGEAYDAMGRRISQTDPAGNLTRFEYDARGALTRVTDALGNRTAYAYNDLDKRVSQTDPLGRTTRFDYDVLGRLIRTTLPLGQTEARAYDIAGRLLSLRDFNGAQTSYTYDAMFRLTRRTLPDGEVHAFTYTPTGLMASVADRTGTTSLEYDLRNRPTLVRRPDGAEIHYTYDAAGNRTGLSTPGGSLAYAYDAANRLSAVTDLDGGQSTFAYDPAGNLTSLAYPNGIEARYQYDTVNRLTDLTHTSGASSLRSFHYTLGPAGNRTRVTEETGRAVDYTYDALFRLTGETVTEPGQASSSIAYSYDAAGNRVSQSGTPGSVTYSYDANSRLVSSAGQTFTYDANGNLLSAQGAGGLTTYAYDGMNRLIRATVAGTTTEYAHNALGHRVRMTGATGPADYLVDPFGAQNLSQVLRETSASGAVDYVHGGGVLLSMRRPTGTSFYLHDGRASTRMLADMSGAITDRYDYDPFGNVRARHGATPNEFLFAGQRLDSALRLYDLRARLYDPVAGRFTTRDPFAGSVFDPGSLHPYTYAHNDPVNRSDPSGQFTLAETMAVSAGVGVLAGLSYAAESYYYYRSADVAFEAGVDAAFSYASLVLDMVGGPALARAVGKQIISGVSAVMAGKTILTHSADDVGKSVATRLTDVFENALCRTNNIRRCGKIVVQSVEEAAEEIAKREAERIAAVEAALAEVRVGAEEAARRAAERAIKNSTVTLGELASVTVEGIKGGFRTVVKWFERRVRPPM